MPYVQRGDDGKICGQFANIQTGIAEEWLDEGSAGLKAEKPQSVINAEARSYLFSTDWYVIRKQETGESIPEEVLAERARRRAEVVQ